MSEQSSREYPSTHLSARDVRVLLLWLLAALIGVSVAYRYFFQAFPEASAHFKVTRNAALEQARGFVMAQGASLDGYQSTIVFSVDDNQKTFLEREAGLDQANRLMSSEVNVWFWDVRFFRPLQKEEFHVHVDPAGRIVGFEHILEEASPGARLERAEALARAQTFLRDALRVSLEGHTFLPDETNSNERPNRRDWSFTWERTGFRVQDAPYRLRVTLEGDRIGGYQEFLKVPEAWQRSYARLRSSNDFVETMALIPYAGLVGAALSVILALGRRGLARWRGALKLGLFITLLYFVMQMNQWPLTRAGYDTNSSYASFFIVQIALALLISAGSALLVVIAVVPGEPLYRVGQPDRLRLESAFRLPGLRTKEFFCAGVIGVCLAGAHIGYVVLFYVIGRRFGVWAPQDLQYSDTLSTALPWIYPLTIGIYAAASEEFLFRMFSIRFLLRGTKSKLLAVLLPAFAWGFLHSNYPQEPAYARGIEVGLIGIVAGLVMLRWGILATLAWHYTVDAFLVSLSLIRSPDWYNRISGTMVGLGVLIPVGIAGVLYLARGGFVDETALLNRAEPLVEAPAAPETSAPPSPAPEYAPLTPRMLAVLGLCGALGVALFWGVKTKSVGGFVEFPLNARQAELRADDVLRNSQVDPASYRRATTIQYTFDPFVNEYLRRSVGLDAANRIYRDQAPSAFWTVRYFRDSQPEEYLVVLRPDGALHSLHHTLPEAAPAPNWTDEQALARAETFLQQTKGLDLAQWRLVGQDSKKQPARTDHTFTWEQLTPLAPPVEGDEGAYTRVEVKVQGDEVSGYRVFIHVPEAWLRKQNERTFAGTARSIGFVLLITVLGIAVLVVFFRNLKQPAMTAVPWRRLARWSLPVLGASLAYFLTLEPQTLASYPTDKPFKIFLGTAVIGSSLGAALFYSAAFFLFGLSWFFLASAYGAGRLRGWRGMPASYYRDALVIGICGCAILAGVHRLPDLVGRLWPVPRHWLPASVPEVLDASQPAVYGLAVAVLRSFFAIGLLGLALGFAARYFRRTWQQMLLLAVFAVLMVPQWGSAGDFLQAAAAGFTGLVVIWWGAQRVVRFNLLGYFLVGMFVLLAGPAADLLRQPNALFHANGWGLAIAAGILLIWTFGAWQRSSRRRAVETAAGPLA